MPLVDYSSESSTSEDDSHQIKKRKIAPDLPPLPSSFQDLYATPVRTSKVDDPTLHGGRHRVNPHIEGNWPTHIYTEWNPSEDERKLLHQLIHASSLEGHEVHGLLLSDLGAPAPLHISLSRSLGLQSEQRYDFSERLRLSIEQADVQFFTVSALGLRWVPNFTNNRWFLVLQLDSPPKDELKRLLKASNEVASSFGHPGLYTEMMQDPLCPNIKSHSSRGEIDSENISINVSVSRSLREEDKVINPFHISIAWSLSQPPGAKNTEFLVHTTANLSKLKIPVNAVKAKIGNNILSVSLRSVSSQVTSKALK